MLRAADSFWKTDTGRQRRDNEDNAFVRAPLFVVADGMGGAQAGEALLNAVLAGQAGIPMSSVYEVLPACSGGTRAIRVMEQFSSPQAYADQVRPFMVKDVSACEQVAVGRDRVAHGPFEMKGLISPGLRA